MSEFKKALLAEKTSCEKCGHFANIQAIDSINDSGWIVETFYCGKCNKKFYLTGDLNANRPRTATKKAITMQDKIRESMGLEKKL